MLSGQQRKKLREALIDAFPDKSSLEQLLDFELEKNLKKITKDSNLEEIVFELIKRAESEGWLIELVLAARDERPGNKVVQSIANELLSNQITPSPSENEEYNSTVYKEFAPKLGDFLEIETTSETQTPNSQSELNFGIYSENQSELLESDIKENLVYGVNLEMVAIPRGILTMGSPKNEQESQENERPQHQVAIQPFFMGKYTITQEQWEKVAAFLPQVNYELNANPSKFTGDNQPVEQVSWDEAVEFCHRLSRHTSKQYRLPSEAEWEYACRAGKTTPFYFGETITTNVANYNGAYTYSNAPEGEYRRRTTPVGSFPPNIFGLYDMHGNLWEWCQDTWHGNYEGAPKDGSPWLGNDHHQTRLLRGGSWYTPPEGCRSGYRYKYDSNQGNDRIGFRVVCDAVSKA